MKLLLSTAEAARILEISTGSVWYLVSMCRLDSVRVRGRCKITSSSLNEYVNQGFEGKNRSGISCDSECTGSLYDSELFGTDALPADEGRRPAGLERRRRQLVLRKKGRSGLYEKELNVKQLMFDFDEAV